MSTGLAVFDTTVQESNEWLKAIEARLQPCGRSQAYGAFRAVTHVLRDRLPMEGVLGLSAQLPILLRGVFLEGWRPGDGPTDIRDPSELAQAVTSALPRDFPREGLGTARAVLQVLAERLDAGEVQKLIAYLPAALRPLWEPEPWPA
ncbi:MAG: DUF2267 domain-containing protein [Phenylobacterium sp.]